MPSFPCNNGPEIDVDPDILPVLCLASPAMYLFLIDFKQKQSVCDVTDFEKLRKIDVKM